MIIILMMSFNANMCQYFIVRELQEIAEANEQY